MASSRGLRSPRPSAPMARENSSRAPEVNRFAASQISPAEWVIMPGRTKPTLMLRSATMTKISSSATTQRTLLIRNVSDGDQIARAVEKQHEQHRSGELQMKRTKDKR